MSQETNFQNIPPFTRAFDTSTTTDVELQGQRFEGTSRDSEMDDHRTASSPHAPNNTGRNTTDSNDAHADAQTSNETQADTDMDYDQKARDDAAYEAFKSACEQQFGSYTPMTFPLPKVGDGDHWKACHDILEKHDNYLFQGWNSDIDTLLVFAGLFSAAVTAFTIDSYKWLQGTDSGDTTVLLLQQISRQLADPNITVTPLEEFHISPSQRRINIFWFLSLVVALMTSLLGILCKQWLREYQKDAALSYKDSVALRQMRFEAFRYWRVENFISALPLLLQLALLLFIIGVLDLLWSLDRIAASVITVAAVLGFGFVVFSTIIPGVIILANGLHGLHWGKGIPPGAPVDVPSPLSAFKSPQAWLFTRALLVFFNTKAHLGSWLDVEKRVLGHSQMLARYAYRSVYWMDDNFSQNEETIIHLAHCVQDLRPEYYLESLDDILTYSEIPHNPRDVTKDDGKIVVFLFLSRPGRDIGWQSRLLLAFAELMIHAASRKPQLWTTVFTMSPDAKSEQVFRCRRALWTFYSHIESDDHSASQAFLSAMLASLLNALKFDDFYFFLALGDIKSDGPVVDFVNTVVDKLAMSEPKMRHLRQIVVDSSLRVVAQSWLRLSQIGKISRTEGIESVDFLLFIIEKVRPSFSDSDEWTSLKEDLNRIQDEMRGGLIYESLLVPQYSL